MLIIRLTTLAVLILLVTAVNGDLLPEMRECMSSTFQCLASFSTKIANLLDEPVDTIELAKACVELDEFANCLYDFGCTLNDLERRILKRIKEHPEYKKWACPNVHKYLGQDQAFDSLGGKANLMKAIWESIEAEIEAEAFQEKFNKFEL